MTDKQNNNNDEPEILEGEYEDSSETALAEISGKHDIVLGTQAAHEALEIRAKGLEALRRASIKALNKNDFHRFGNNWWLQSSGVSKISEIYGIDFTAPRFSKEWKDRYDEDSKEVISKSHYIIKCEITATFTLDRRSYTATGSASTRDPFFMRDSKHPHPLNVDEENVRKKAETNARARCLIGLGIANFTPDELTQAGLEVDKTTGHDFKKTPPKNLATDEDRKLLHELFNSNIIGVDDKHPAHEWLDKQPLTKKEINAMINKLDLVEESIEYEEFEKFVKGGYK